MLSKILAFAFVASAAAQSISITNPGPNTWWIAESLNTLAWSPCDTSIQGSIPAFNVVVFNSNQVTLAGNLTILGNQPTFDCSHTITDLSLTAGTGYTMMLTNAINTNQVYTSTTFEVKAKGSTYPSSSSSASAGPTNTTSGSAPSATSSSGKNAAGILGVAWESLFTAAMGAGVIGAWF